MIATRAAPKHPAVLSSCRKVHLSPKARLPGRMNRPEALSGTQTRSLGRQRSRLEDREPNHRPVWVCPAIVACRLPPFSSHIVRLIIVHTAFYLTRCEYFSPCSSRCTPQSFVPHELNEKLSDDAPRCVQTALDAGAAARLRWWRAGGEGPSTCQRRPLPPHNNDNNNNNPPPFPLFHS